MCRPVPFRVKDHSIRSPTHHIRLEDPITGGTLVNVDWTTDNTGSGIEVQALNNQYSALLAIELEHGRDILFGASGPESDDAIRFRASIFQGMPTSLVPTTDDGVALLVRGTAGTEHPIRARRILHSFLDSVAMAQHGNFAS